MKKYIKSKSVIILIAVLVVTGSLLAIITCVYKDEVATETQMESTTQNVKADGIDSDGIDYSSDTAFTDDNTIEYATETQMESTTQNEEADGIDSN